MIHSRPQVQLPRWFTPGWMGVLFALLLLVRNAWLYWMYGIAFYPDSNLYAHLGAVFFETWSFGTLVTYPYPLLNALTGSFANPAALLWLQFIFSAAAGGFFVYAAAREHSPRAWAFALLSGLLLLADLVWGSFLRAILTDGVFATLHLLALALLLLHYDRRGRLPAWELVLAGLLYGLVVSFRPSNIFLTPLFPAAYLWLTRSWKKAAYLTVGLALFFLSIGLINLRGAGQFAILLGDTDKPSYTDEYLAFPLLVYKLYDPANGPSSQRMDAYLQTCYPGMVYAEAVDRSSGAGFNSPNNNDLIYNRVFPCLKTQSADAPNGSRGLIRDAYLESLTSAPLRFTQVMAQELAVFLRYANPYLLRLHLDPSKNYSCTDLPWCGTIYDSRAVWDANSSWVGLYEKSAAKMLQAYLAPVGLFSLFSPDKQYLPYLLSWALTFAFTVIASRGRMRFVALAAAVFVLYTGAVVVASLGFSERYAAMLTPVQAVYSAVFWITLGEVLLRLYRSAAQRRGFPAHIPADQ